MVGWNIATFFLRSDPLCLSEECERWGEKGREGWKILDGRRKVKDAFLGHSKKDQNSECYRPVQGLWLSRYGVQYLTIFFVWFGHGSKLYALYRVMLVGGFNWLGNFSSFPCCFASAIILAQESPYDILQWQPICQDILYCIVGFGAFVPLPLLPLNWMPPLARLPLVSLSVSPFQTVLLLCVHGGAYKYITLRTYWRSRLVEFKLSCVDIASCICFFSPLFLASCTSATGFGLWNIAGIATHAMNLLISKCVEEGKRDMSTSQRGYLTRRMRYGPLERVLHKEPLIV